MFGREPPTVRPVGALKAIVETGKPRKAHPSVYLEVPLAVLVDLGVVFPLPSFYSAERVEGGLRLRAVVEGRLTVWTLSHEGDWLGLVACDVGNSDEGGLPQRVVHWLPARGLNPRDAGCLHPSSSGVGDDGGLAGLPVGAVQWVLVTQVFYVRRAVVPRTSARRGGRGWSSPTPLCPTPQ